MQEIKPKVVDLPTEERPREYDSYSSISEAIKRIENRLDKLELVNLKYFCRAFRATNQSIAPGAAVIALTNTEYPQFGNMHDNANDNNYIFIKRSGVYHLSATIQWELNATGTFRQVSIRLLRDGVTTTLVSQRGAVSAAILTTNCACDHYLYEDDRIEMLGNHDAAVAINVLASNPQSPSLSVTERMEDLKPEELGLLNPIENMR